MRVLWFCNTLPEGISQGLFGKYVPGGGWIEGMAAAFRKNDGVELFVAARSPFCAAPRSHRAAGITYHVFSNKLSGEKLEVYLAGLLEQVRPDLVHIFGAEHPQSQRMLKLCRDRGFLDRALLHIQGLAGVCADHYCRGIPQNHLRRRTLRDLLRRGGIAVRQKQMEALGKGEAETIRMARHVSGRTDWDRQWVSTINPEVRYHFCNETLRSPFYQGHWTYESCRRHSIFACCGTHPLKGLHLLLEAMPRILRDWPDAHLYVTGHDPMAAKSWLARQKNTYYVNYIAQRIRQLGLTERITFLGNLRAEEMKEQFLKSNVFVLSSLMENSPNALGEAMLLGVPAVASAVGGVPDLLVHGREGLTYPAEEPDMLAARVNEVFEQGEKIASTARAGQCHARKRYDPEANHRRLLEIYHTILTEAEP